MTDAEFLCTGFAIIRSYVTTLSYVAGWTFLPFSMGSLCLTNIHHYMKFHANRSNRSKVILSSE